MLEYDAAFARGSIRQWPVAERYVIVDGRLVEQGDPNGRSSYMPVGRPVLLEEFAKLHRGDEAAVLEFAGRRGLLGFRESAVQRTGERDQLPGDPLDWIWVHSEQVRRTINLLALRKSSRAEELFEAISKMVSVRVNDHTFIVDFALPDGEFRKVAQTFTYGEGSLHLSIRDSADIGIEDSLPVTILPNINIPSVPPEFQDRLGKYRLLVEIIAQEVINRNINCPSKIIIPEFGHLVRSYVYSSLMEVVYSHLADYAGGDRIYVRCKFCHSYFRQTHGRQIFCPPVVSGTESLCAMRQRKADWTERNSAQSERIEKPNSKREAAS